MDSIDNLPAMLIGAVRRGAWISPQAFRLRETARAVQQGVHVGVDMFDLTTALAAVALEEAALVATTTPEVERVVALTTAHLTTAVAFHAREAAYGPLRTVEDVQNAVRAHVAANYAEIEASARLAV